jgi:hypothetical protein
VLESRCTAPRSVTARSSHESFGTVTRLLQWQAHFVRLEPPVSVGRSLTGGVDRD